MGPPRAASARCTPARAHAPGGQVVKATLIAVVLTVMVIGALSMPGVTRGPSPTPTPSGFHCVGECDGGLTGPQ